MTRRIPAFLLPLLFLVVAEAGTRNDNTRFWQLEGRPRNFPRYSVQYQICLLTGCDVLNANALGQRLNAITNQNAGLDVPLPEGFEKTRQLVLRYHANSLNIHYDIDPKPVSKQPFPDTNEIHLFFDKWHMLGQIPFVTVTAEIEAACSINPYEPLKDRESFLKETPAWPTRSAVIKDLVPRIPVHGSNELARLESVLHWLRFESGIRSGDGPAGQRATRSGVAYTLQTKQGNCWDFSDLFVTLCRSMGLPARQVAGWQLTGGGHLWAEVYVDNIGWIQVNPTTGKTISEDYLPLFTTSDGTLSYVFRSFPVIKKMGTEQLVPRDGR